MVIGLDCASPELVFQRYRAHLPHLSQLMNGGTWGVMRSSLPCITVPAWASMFSGRDAGELGVYGFRNRANYGYDELSTADSHSVQFPRVWDYLTEHNKPSLVVNVPQTYPIKPLKGSLVSDFTTPNRESAFTFPTILKSDLLKKFPNYSFDAGNFRTSEKPALLQRIYDLTEIQYQAFEHLLTTQEWDFAVHVNIGVDRIHHAFWRYQDPQHRLYEPNNPFENAIKDYYRFVDAWVGRVLAHVDDRTSVLVVSDHGAKRMDGAIAINHWLWQNGWLALKSTPPEGQIQAFNVQDVDWTQTRAWSTGGYYGRIFMNVQGREPQGVIATHEIESMLNTLTEQLKAITSPEGTPLSTRVFRPHEVYKAVNGFAPDLIVYFGDLHWRAVGGVGYPTHYTLENDTGPDDANHAEEGMFILHEAQKGQGEVAPYQLMDVASTVLHRLRVPIPAALQGRIMS